MTMLGLINQCNSTT